MATELNLNAIFASRYDEDAGTIRFATCRCHKACPVYMTINELPDKTTLRCDGKRITPHRYSDITIDPELADLRELGGGQVKKRVTVKSIGLAVFGWLDLLGHLAEEEEEEEEDEEQTPQGKVNQDSDPNVSAESTVEKPKGTKSVRSESESGSTHNSGRQTQLPDTLDGMSLTETPVRRSPRNISKVASSVTSKIPDMTMKLITSTKKPSGGGRSPVILSEKSQEDESQPTIAAWITDTIGGKLWAKVTAATLKHIGMMIIRYGLVFGVSIPKLLQAWDEKDPKSFLSGLAPIVELCWREKWLGKAIGKKVADVLGHVLSSGVSIQQLMLVRSLISGSPTAGPHVTSLDPVYLAFQGALKKDAKQRKILDEAGKRIRDACN